MHFAGVTYLSYAKVMIRLANFQNEHDLSTDCRVFGGEQFATPWASVTNPLLSALVTYSKRKQNLTLLYDRRFM